ncbi:hypothetical protein ACQEVZ_54905 [Dactylosporangium sp. CA-152071]|uniref:hypothetical protein n=1 Tax=Dactylosporangium sp. CA-152071 TaxID=3239933 RepID=UPI003D900ADA
MATVNWERASGEAVEEFVAALLLIHHNGAGNRITPSSGDGGRDVQLRVSGGYDHVQVKRFASRLTSTQRRQVEKSWTTFVAKTLPVMPVRSWALACPWDPTREQLAWLEELTRGHDVDVSWIGRAQLDGLAAQYPSLVEYFFGDGGERLQRLMADALQGGRDVPRAAAGDDLLDAVSARSASLARSLGEVDPFYVYEIEVRHGKVDDEPIEQVMARESRAAFEQWTQLDAGRYQVLRLVPRFPQALELSPIGSRLLLEAEEGSSELTAIEEFHRFGAPFRDIPGTVQTLTGPPGLRIPTGPGTLTVLPLSQAESARPDLEARLVTADGDVAHALDLVNVRTAAASAGRGWWLSGHDRSGVLEFQFFMNSPDGVDEVRIRIQPTTGLTPADAVPAVRMTAAMVPGTRLVLGLRDGPAVTAGWPLDDDATTAEAARQHLVLLDALAAIQRHTFDRISIPDLNSTPADQIAEILHVGRLLQGHQETTTWSEVVLAETPPENVPDQPEFVLMFTNQLTVRIDGRQLPLLAERRILYQSARVAESVAGNGKLRIVPGSTPTAIVAAVPFPGAT